LKLRASSGKAAPGGDRSPVRPRWGDGLAWAIALGGFLYAFAAALRHESYDLRTPIVLLSNVFAATGIALGYAAQSGISPSLSAMSRCLTFGLWSAAIFRLRVIGTNEDMLFDLRFYTADVPYVLLFAAVRGCIVAFLAWPFAERAVQKQGRAPVLEGDQAWQLTAATVIVFFIVAAAVRLLAAIR